MASLQREATGMFHVAVRINGQRFKRSLETKNEAKATARKLEIEEMIDLLKRGKIQKPDSMPAIDYVLGKSVDVENDTVDEMTTDQSVPLLPTFESFLDSIPEGNLEPDTLKMLDIHKRHLTRILGKRFDLSSLTNATLQDYISKRAKEKSQFFSKKPQKGKKPPSRKSLSATTIRKEITTLGSLWSWAETASLVCKTFPKKGLRYPKTDEKPPFQTWNEIERQIQSGALNESEIDLLWDALYLRQEELEELLKFVKSNARYPFIYPMFVFATHTGARRIELLRSKVSDFDFQNDSVIIRERKGCVGKDRLVAFLSQTYSKPQCLSGLTFTPEGLQRLQSKNATKSNQSLEIKLVTILNIPLVKALGTTSRAGTVSATASS